MDNAESMNFDIAFFFVNHHIHNRAPAFKRITILEGIIQQCEVTQANLRLILF